MSNLLDAKPLDELLGMFESATQQLNQAEHAAAEARRQADQARTHKQALEAAAMGRMRRLKATTCSHNGKVFTSHAGGLDVSDAPSAHWLERGDELPLDDDVMVGQA